MNSDINKYTKEVEESLTRLFQKKDKEKADKLKKYIGTNLNVLGLVTKLQVDTYKKGFSFYSNDLEKTFLIFDHIYKNSNTFEVKNQAFIFLDKHHKHIPLKTQLLRLPLWIKHIDNWAHSDSLSKYLTRLLEHPESKEKIIQILKKWNTSKNLWERRQSLIALYYYARTKKQYVSFNLTIEFIAPLLTDKEYFVQKAVGWTLRESYNVYPNPTYQFIEENIKTITSTAFTTCLEKMSETEKEKLKIKRKNKKV